MAEKANHSIVIGKGADAKTIAAGETLPGGLPKDEIKRLRDLGAIGDELPGEVAADGSVTTALAAGAITTGPAAKNTTTAAPAA